MLVKITKGLQVTIPAKIRNALEIEEGSVLDIELDTGRKRIIVEPIKQPSFKILFAKWDKVKIKTKKSIKEMEREYERENMLH